jgi:hypothetical protein
MLSIEVLKGIVGNSIDDNDQVDIGECSLLVIYDI